MKRLAAFIFFIACVLSHLQAVNISRSDVDAAIDRLDASISRRSQKIAARQQSIDSLKSIVGTDSLFYRLMSVAEAYRSFNNDSALHYFDKASAAASSAHMAFAARVNHASLLPLGGYVDEAINEFNACDTTGLDNDLKVLYHDCGRRLYSYVIAGYTDRYDVAEQYQSRAREHQRLLLDLLDRNSDTYKFNLGEYYFSLGDFSRASALFEEIAEKSDDKRLIAKANHHLSTIARKQNHYNAYLYHLAVSAAADMEIATLEVRSLQQLGSELYENGDIDHSYRYLTTALANAVDCGASLRMVETSRSVPLIAGAHNNQLKVWRRTIYIIMALMLVLLLSLGFSLLRRYRETQRLKRLQQKLKAANADKDVYISQFMKLCSIYMDKLNQFCKLTERKISAGKTDELYRLTKSGKFVEEQSAEFYEIFDNAFLHLYPDFVSRVNSLLKPDEQIELRDGEKLNTSLRILAVARMGIDDAATVAQILNFSVNTIYSYRNRIKMRAINRETFDNDILKI